MITLFDIEEAFQTVVYILHIVELGYLAHAPDESTTANCALDNRTRSLASSIILTRPHL